MKKPLLIRLYLIGLSAFNQVSAQHDLDIVNHGSCTFTLLGGETAPVTCVPNATISTPVAAGATLFTVTYTGAPYYVNKFQITDVNGISVILYDYTICGFGQILSATIPTSLLCPAGATVTLLPATPSNNALIDIF
jgi:hypothetical protein